MKLNEANNLDIDETVQAYMDSISKYKSLNKRQEHLLLSRYKHFNDIDARNELVNANLKYTCKLANNFRGRGIPFSTLISEANNALIYAIEKFDESQNVKLMVYAKWWINQRITSLINREKSIIEEDLPEEHETIDFSDDYDDTFYVSDDYINHAFVNEDKEYETNNNVQLLNSLYSDLDERECDIINMRFGRFNYNKEYTLEEIGEKYSLTKERVRQIVEKALLKMRSQAMLSNDNSYIL